MIRNFCAALALLTRFGPARLLDSARIAASVPWYAPVGALIGLACTAPLYIGLASGLPWVQAWIYMGLNLWITRALHWDGLADLADAWGSGARGERFWAVLKDSRTGVFGALGLCFFFSGGLIAAQALCAANTLVPLALAPLVGRAACALLAALNQPRDPASLGGMALAGATARAGITALATTLIPCAFFLKPTALCGMALGIILLLALLSRLGRREGGMNGDFLGAAVIAGELMTLFAGIMP